MWSIQKNASSAPNPFASTQPTPASSTATNLFTFPVSSNAPATSFSAAPAGGQNLSFGSSNLVPQTATHAFPTARPHVDTSSGASNSLSIQNQSSISDKSQNLTYSYPHSSINQLLFDSCELAAKCSRSYSELYGSQFMLKFSTETPAASSGYSFLSKHGIDLSKLDAQIHRVSSLTKREKAATSDKPSHEKKNLSPTEYQQRINSANQQQLEDSLRMQRYDAMKKSILDAIASQWDSYRSGTLLGHLPSPVIVLGGKSIEVSVQIPTIKTILNDHKARAFAEIVSELVNYRISQQTSKSSPLVYFPICNRLLSVLSPFSHDQIYSGLSDVLRFISAITNEAGLKEEFIPSESSFASSAKSFFEREFVSHMNKIITQSLREAVLGGRPNLIDKVRAYTNVRLAQRNRKSPSSAFFDCVESFHGGEADLIIYPWATLYFLIRAGAEKSHLISWIETFESYFIRSDKYFKDALIAFSSDSSHANESLLEFIKNEYLRLDSTRDSVDPFRLVIYALLSSSLSKKKYLDSPPLSIISSFEDWIWYNLVILKEGSLAEFRQTVQKFGPSYFESGGNPTNYLKLLFYIGLFDEGLLAMLRLSPAKPNIFIEAIHICIALLYHAERLPFTNFDVPLHLLRQYITLLTAAHSKGSSFVALEYIMTFSFLPNETLQCFEVLVDWILSTRSFKSILASIDEKGLVQPGIITHYVSLISLTDDQKKEITKGLEFASSPSILTCISWQVANKLLLRATSEDEEEAALGLFHICGAYEKIFNLLARKLSEALANNKAAPSVPSSIARQARGTRTFYEQYAPDRAALNSPQCKRAISRMSLLLGLYDALAMQRSSRPDKVLEILVSLELIKFNALDEKLHVHSSFLDTEESYSILTRHLGLLLETALHAISELYLQFDRGTAVGYTISELKAMGPSTFSALTRLDALIQ